MHHGRSFNALDQAGNCAITRGWDFGANLSGGTETFIPADLLGGQMPSALLEVSRMLRSD
jgi:hypothetical protein